MQKRCRQGQSWWQPKFQGRGYRMTVPRQVILEVLSGTEKHLSAEDIYLAVQKSYPHVGLTTVYRTLELLADMGVLFKFDFGDRRARYELAEEFQVKKGHHHHLVCTRCKRVIDYTEFIDQEKELLEKTERGLMEKYDFSIEKHLIQFYGTCGKCRKKTV
ncbi:MAG: transcriptional repressor [Candidatus Omnitrophica bacterium]|nr:transcriptional repressor [Candidatus Omnitrophota bacterium]